MRVLFVSWRDLAHPQAGGSEVLVDHLATGLAQRGHDVALLCGGPVGHHPYRVFEGGGTYTQYLRAPLRYWRRLRDVDLVVDIENGIPFFSPVWRRGPVICLVHHIHRDQWPLRFPTPVAQLGRLLEGRLMPYLYRNALFIAVSPSTLAGLTDIGVPAGHIRLLTEGVEAMVVPSERSATPLFVVVGRLVPHKRIDLVISAWERVRPEVGGRLLVVGDGPERERLEALAGPDVAFLGHVSDETKWGLLTQSWLLVHGARHEGWGLVALEAAAAGTPTLAMDAPGVRDAVLDSVTGVLVRSEDELVNRWVALTRAPVWRATLGAQARRRAATLTWDAAVDRFLEVAREAVAAGTPVPAVAAGTPEGLDRGRATTGGAA